MLLKSGVTIAMPRQQGKHPYLAEKWRQIARRRSRIMNIIFETDRNKLGWSTRWDDAQDCSTQGF